MNGPFVACPPGTADRSGRPDGGRTPLLSVVMPVHNALPYLDAAIESILEQTLSDFEFVILDDGSTDGSAERLRHWAERDPRIRLVLNDSNAGPAESSNLVVQNSCCDLVARMDADDIAHRDRLRSQIDLIMADPDIGIVGTAYDTIDSDGLPIRGPNSWRLFHPSWFVPFPHGSILFRRDVFDRLGGYRRACVFWEDQDFFLRASAITRLVTLCRPLYSHRHSSASTRLASRQLRVEAAVDLMYRCVDRLRHGRDYEDLLGAGAPDSAKVDPRVFVSLGSLTLWAGRRPRLLGRLLSRARLSFSARTASALVWTAWAAIAPALLRSFLRSLAQARNSLVAPRLRGTDHCRWLTPGPYPGTIAVQSRPTISPASANR